MSRFALGLLVLIATASVARSDSTSALRGKLRHHDAGVRLHAAARLAELTAARSAERVNFALEMELAEALSDRHVMVRFYAAEALGHLGPRSFTASRALAYSVVCDPEWIVSRKAAIALQRVNPRFKDVSLETMLQKRLPEGLRAPLLARSDRRSVGAQFEKLLLSAEVPLWAAIVAEPTESLVARINDPQGFSRHPAALAVPPDQALFARFVAALELQRRVAPAAFVPRIVPLLDAKDGDLRRIALAILLERGEPGEELAIQVLAGFPPANRAEALLDKARTITTIASVRPEDLVSPHLLRRFYDTRDVGIQLALVEAIPRLGAADAETQEFLARMCAHADSEMRERAATAVRDAGLTEHIVRKFFVPDLLSNEEIRWNHAWTALGAFAPRDSETRFLRSLREHDSPRVRLAAVSMLQRAGVRQDPEALIPLLVDMLAGPEPWTRSKAAEVLGVIGPPARDAIPELGRAISDENQTVSSTAMEALKAIGRSDADPVRR